MLSRETWGTLKIHVYLQYFHMNCHRKHFDGLEPFLILPKSRCNVTCATASYPRIGGKHIKQDAKVKTELNKAVFFQYLKDLY